MQKKNKKNSHFKKWLNYKIDSYITKGFRAQFVLLFISILLIVLIFGLIAGLVSGGVSIGSGIWQSLMHIIDQGTISGDETGDVGYVIVMLLVTFLGMAFTGTIVGIINNAMSDKLDELRKGHSQIIEDGHVVIIGFDNNIHTLLSQMGESNKNWTGNKKIVVVDDMPKEDMEHLAKEHDRELSLHGQDGHREKRKLERDVIYRSGSIVSENTYTMASVEKARAIIINKDDDFPVIRVILALVTYLKKHGAYYPNEMPSIISLMHEKENITAAEIAAEIDPTSSENVGRTDGTKVRVMYFEDILAHIFAQVCRQPGLSWVISELFDYKGSEIYIESEAKGKVALNDKLLGKSFGEISEMLTNSILIGLQRETEIIINPDPKMEMFREGDKLIHLAKDDNEIEITENVDVENIYAESHIPEASLPKYNLLVFGWSVPLPEIIHDIDKYAYGGGTVRIITRHQSDEEMHNVCPYYKKRQSKKAKRGVEDIGELERLSLIPEESMDPYDWDNVNRFLIKKGIWDKNHPEFPTNILILCQDGIDKLEADERAAVLLLNIRSFLQKEGLDDLITITTEMNMPENQILLQHTSINDFIVGSEIANRMMVQVANNPDIYPVFVELLNDKGSELYLRKIDEYVDDISKEFSFEDIQRAARGRVSKSTTVGKQEIVLGWIRTEKGKDIPEVVLNPTGDEKTRQMLTNPGDSIEYKLIVLAKNEASPFL